MCSLGLPNKIPGAVEEVTCTRHTSQMQKAMLLWYEVMADSSGSPVRCKHATSLLDYDYVEQRRTTILPMSLRCCGAYASTQETQHVHTGELQLRATPHTLS